MAKTITMSFPHELTPEEVKRRMTSALADARAKYPDALKGASETWSGDRMDFSAAAMGNTITGFVEVQPKTVNVSVTLPFVLGLFAGKIRPRVEEEARRLLK